MCQSNSKLDEETKEQVVRDQVNETEHREIVATALAEAYHRNHAHIDELHDRCNAIRHHLRELLADEITVAAEWWREALTTPFEEHLVTHDIHLADDAVDFIFDEATKSESRYLPITVEGLRSLTNPQRGSALDTILRESAREPDGNRAAL